jgi:hypothetical protein
LVGGKFGDYVIVSERLWRKNGRSYAEVACPHGEDRVLLDNLKRGQQIGCQQCYTERNGIFRPKNEVEAKLYARYLCIYDRTIYSSHKGNKQVYQDRGIGLCQEWVDNPQAFIDHVKSLPNYDLNLTIDRIDNERGYEPENIRWADIRLQNLNRRTTIRVEWNGEEMSFAEFARRFTDFPVSTALYQFKQGRTLEELTKYVPLNRGSNGLRLSKLREQT